MTYVPVAAIEVRAWGRTVGAVAPSRQRGAYAFEYAPEWARGDVQLAPELMPNSSRVFVFSGLNSATYYGLPPMIADSLPDAFGNAIVDAWLAREGIAKHQVTALDRLAYLGNRGMGALEFLPDHQPKLPAPTALDISELVLSARRAVEGSLASESESRDALRRIIDVGTSAGGARAKAIVNLGAETNEIRSGHFAPEPGFEPWLIKFDGIRADNTLGSGRSFGRVEYAYSLMARAAGVTMAPTRMLEENGRAHFLTKRFDRLPNGRRVHMQTLCAMAALDFNAIGVNDYSQYFQQIQRLGLSEEDLRQAFRRMVFNVAAVNHDDHTKNFAFLLDETGAWQLAPAYDVTHAYASSSIWLQHHLMSVNGKFDDITRADLMTVAERFNVVGAAQVITDVNDALSSWAEFAMTAGLDVEVADAVATDFKPIRR
jgi:serine/threonine-protein kinase HipA